MSLSCDMLVFGGTGDLALHKLLPALYHLHREGRLHRDFRVVALARQPLDRDGYLALAERHCRAQIARVDFEPGTWQGFAERLDYFAMDASQRGEFVRLAHHLGRVDGRVRVYYLATAPGLFEAIATNLQSAGLAGPESRIVLEKPIGHDLDSALAINQAIGQVFAESRVYRIDHYLGKETVQNLMALRFANALFEPVWNRRYIDHIRITAAETIGIGHRAGFYDQAGVLRDMFQNHMMMLLSLCAMEPPSLFEAELVRDERSKVFRALRPLDLERLDEQLILGQYGPGMSDGKAVPGYLQEPGVPPDSTTPTFAWLKVYLDNWRWQGVPFHLCSGKRLEAKHTEISVQFKSVPVSMFRKTQGDIIPPNRLVIGIHPHEVVRLEVQTKGQGSSLCLQGQSMEFSYGAGSGLGRLDDYAKVLLDCITGDQTLFWRQDAVELCWGFLTPILDRCDCPDSKFPLHTYVAGGPGPKAAQRSGS